MKVLRSNLLIICLVFTSRAGFAETTTNAAISAQLSARLLYGVEMNYEELAGSLGAIAFFKPGEGNCERIRAAKTKLWFNLLDQIERLRDPGLDFNDLPTANVAPPDRRYPPGVDPCAIADLTVRKQYEEAIALNREKATRLTYELRLKQLAEHMVTLAAKDLQNGYQPTTEDRAELLKHLNANIHSESLKRAIKAKLRGLLDQ